MFVLLILVKLFTIYVNVVLFRLRFDRWPLRLDVVTSTRNQHSGCFKIKQVKTWSHLHCFLSEPCCLAVLVLLLLCVLFCLLSFPLCVLHSQLYVSLGCSHYIAPSVFLPNHQLDMILWVSQDSVHLFNQQNSGIYVNAYIHNNYIPLTTITGNY